jgi:CBS domain-containing membrane protein
MDTSESDDVDDVKVGEVMTAQVIALRPQDNLARACARVLDERISALPVLDPDGRPLGVISKSDLLLASVRGETGTVEEKMSSPAAIIRSSAPLSIAAAVMSQRGYHRLVVVDETGAAVGILSAIDVLRWLARHAGIVLSD